MLNVPTIFILAALIIQFSTGVIADYLNLKHLKIPLPGEFAAVFDVERYKQSQEYLKTNTLFGWFVSGFDLFILLVFWFSEGFRFLFEWVGSLGLGNIPSGLVYIGVLVFLKAILSFPFNVYQTFVIEERFGFNQTSWKTFILDRIKIGLLVSGIGIPLLAGILWFFESAGNNAWLYCWVAVTLFSLGLTYVAPTWIMPIFNKFSPLEDTELKSRIFSYAHSVDFPIKNVFVMDGSRRSGKSNAFFTGFGKNKRIALFDTLMEQHTTSEIMAILAHEIGHYKKHHIRNQMLLGILHSGLMFFLLSVFLNMDALFNAFFVSEKSIYGGLVFFGLLYTPVEFLLGIIINRMSRRHEFESDCFAAKTTGDPESLAAALKKLAVNNLSNLTPHPFYVFLNDSHPPIMDRIKQVRMV